jgi:hypothetical protein
LVIGEGFDRGFKGVDFVGNRLQEFNVFLAGVKKLSKELHGGDYGRRASGEHSRTTDARK